MNHENEYELCVDILIILVFKNKGYGWIGRKPK